MTNRILAIEGSNALFTSCSNGNADDNNDDEFRFLLKLQGAVTAWPVSVLANMATVMPKNNGIKI